MHKPELLAHYDGCCKVPSEIIPAVCIDKLKIRGKKVSLYSIYSWTNQNSNRLKLCLDWETKVSLAGELANTF